MGQQHMNLPQATAPAADECCVCYEDFDPGQGAVCQRQWACSAAPTHCVAPATEQSNAGQTRGAPSAANRESGGYRDRAAQSGIHAI